MPYAPDSAPTPNSVRLSLCVTSGAKTASRALFPPHVSHQENHNLPYTALCGTFPFSSSITSGAKSVSHALFPPHVSHQEMKAQKQQDFSDSIGHSGAEPPQKSRLSATAEARVMLPEGRRQPTWCSVSEVFRENRSSGATGRNIVKAVCP